MTEERFEEARASLPVQTTVDGRLEILYHGYKFVKENDEYDILDITKGDYQVSIKSDLDKLALFEKLPFIYVCDLFFGKSQLSKLIKIELNELKEEPTEKEYRVKSDIKNRLRSALSKSF